MTIEETKNKILTDLYLSGQLQKKIETICYNHRIPKDSDIHNDILQVTFENLIKLDANKVIQMYQRSEKELIAMGVTIALRKGVYLDNRTPKSWSASIAQQILHASTLNTNYSINTTNIESIQNENINLEADNDEEVFELEDKNTRMWDYIFNNIRPEDKPLLELMLNQNTPKLKGNIKKQYLRMLDDIKALIIKFKKQNL